MSKTATDWPDRAPTLSAQLDLPPDAEPLLNAALNIHPVIGVERSLKITKDHVDADRFLVSIPVRRTTELHDGLISAVQIPDRAFTFLEDELSTAAFLHLGYEHSPRRYKLYLEKDEHAPDGPLFKAAKWAQGSADIRWDHYYRLSPDIPVSALKKYDDHPAAELAHRLIDQLSKQNAPEDQYILDVQGQEDERSSIDIRLYDLEQSVHMIFTDIQQIADHYGCLTEVKGHLRLWQSAPAGHLSLGHDDQGNSFTTLYFDATQIAATSSQ